MGKAIDGFRSRSLTTQNRTFDNIRSELEKLQRDSQGNVKPTVANIKIKDRIKRKLKSIIVDTRHVVNVDRFIESFDLVEKRMIQYFKDFGGFDESKAFLETIIEDTIERTKNSLLESGIEDNIVNEIDVILNQNVTTGAKFRDMVSQVKDFLTGDDDRLGRLVSYSGQIVNDSIHQYARNYMQAAAEGLGLKWFLYSGGAIEDTREFCLDRFGKYWHEKEIESWSRLEWQGKNPNTTPSNIHTLLGGFNCRHELIPALESIVPKRFIKRAEEKGIILE